MITVVYTCLVLFVAMLVLALVNVWRILIRLKKYKVVPMTMFYIFTVLNILTRLLYLVFSLTNVYGVFIVGAIVMQPVFRLSAGLIQSWMMLELTLRIRQSITIDQQVLRGSPLKQNNGSRTGENKIDSAITLGRIASVTLIVTGVIAVSIYVGFIA